MSQPSFAWQGISRSQTRSCFFVGTIPKDTIWGTLGHDIYLNISEFTGNKAIEEIQWATKEGSIIARLRDNKREYFQLNGTYEIFENGTLKIKRLMRNFSNTYKVTVYNTAGALELEKYFYLEVLGKSSSLKFLHFSLNAIEHVGKEYL